MTEVELWAEYPQAKYIAIDKNGTITLFASKPYIVKDMWMVRDGWLKIVGRTHDVCDWENSLITREENGEKVVTLSKAVRRRNE